MNINYWNIALTMSFIIHGVIGISEPQLIFKKKTNKNEKVKRIDVIFEDMENLIETGKKDFIAEEKFFPPFEESAANIGEFAKKHNILGEKELQSLNKSNIADEYLEEIILSDTSIDKSNKEIKKIPAYVDYYNSIRKKIRTNAYDSYNIKAKGEVFLSFVILRDGYLEDLSLNKTFGVEDILREIALNSVKDSAPFPPFPQELNNYDRIQFSLSICFKKNN